MLFILHLWSFAKIIALHVLSFQCMFKLCLRTFLNPIICFITTDHLLYEKELSRESIKH